MATLRCPVFAILLLALAPLAATFPAIAEDPPAPATVVEAIRQGKPLVSFNYRFESVDEDAFAKDARASTLRSAIGWQTASFRGFSALVEFTNVVNLGFGDEHNNGGFGDASNGVTDRPAIVDPESTEVQQAYVRYATRGGVALSLGRQELPLGNHRFVGNVGWRQHHQAFDAFQVAAPLGKKVNARYFFMRNANQVNLRNLGLDGHVAEVVWKVNDRHSLTGYGLVFDFEDTPLFSTTTIGARFVGRTPLRENLAVTYDLELATQQDAGDNPANVDALYHRVTAGLAAKYFEVGAMWEVLGAGEGDGRITMPLSTLHAWNGWADKFLVTPADGLVDTAVSVVGKFQRFRAEAIYHEFSADLGDAEWGTELDVIATYELPWKQSISLKAAFYDADELATDTTKFWAYTTWKY